MDQPVTAVERKEKVQDGDREGKKTTRNYKKIGWQITCLPARIHMDHNVYMCK